MISRRLFSALCAAVALLVPLGCGGGPAPAMGDLITVTGGVTVGGSPMKSGTIHLKATAAGGRDELAVVTDGKYTLTAFAGNYKVAFDVEAAKSSVPAKYRAYTTTDKLMDVKSSNMTQDFDLR